MSENTICLCGGEFGSLTLLMQHASERGHLIRCSCDRLFSTHQHLQVHQRDVHPQHTGSLELALFRTSSFTAQTSYHTCNICNRVHANADGLAMHKRTMHPSCPICLQRFRTVAQLEGHQQATSHCYCTDHSLAVTTNEQLRRHLLSSLHVTGFECTVCDRAFRSDRALSDHLGSDGHANVERAIEAAAGHAGRAGHPRADGALLTPAEEANLRCDECSRNFRRITDLVRHKKSVKHNPLSDLRCPMSDECNQIFTCPSALLFHLEGGKCKSGINRATVNMLVHQHDTGRQITATANVPTVIAAATQHLGTPDELSTRLGALSISHGTSESGRVLDVEDAYDTTSNNDNGVSILTPTTSIHSHSRNTSIAGDTHAHNLPPGRAGEWSFVNNRDNGSQVTPTGSDSGSSSTEIASNWRCPVLNYEKFSRQQHSLITHLNSPAHGPELYHCPTGLNLPTSRIHGKSFKTMSGILQHLEAGACAGGREVLDQVFGMLEDRIAAVTGTSVRLLRDDHA